MKLLRLLPRFRKAAALMDMLVERGNWSRSQIEAFQLERLNQVWRHAVAHVPYYRRLQAELQLPKRFNSLSAFHEQMPILRKASVRDHRMMFLSERAERGQWKLTAGSTGKTTQVFWGHDAHHESLRAKYRFLRMWGIDPLDRCVFLWGHQQSVQPGFAGFRARLMRRATDWLRNRVRLMAYDLSDAQLRRQIRRIQQIQPAWMYCYSSAGYLLAQKAMEMGVRCQGLKMVCLSAEPVRPHFVDVVEDAFRVPAIVEYGSVECGLLASEHPDRTLRVPEDQVILETVPRGDGRYRVVVTVLTNPSFPLLRYDLGDITEQPLEQPDKGFAILSGLAGRNNDLIVRGNGDFIHSLRFDDIFEPIRAVKCWRITQNAIGAVSVAIAPNCIEDDLDLPDIRRQVESVLPDQRVSIEVMNEIPRSAAGKHCWTTSELADTALDAVSELSNVHDSERMEVSVTS